MKNRLTRIKSPYQEKNTEHIPLQVYNMEHIPPKFKFSVYNAEQIYNAEPPPPPKRKYCRPDPPSS